MTQFRDLFSSGAKSYAQFRPDYPEELLAFVAALPARREIAWDCGTGGGQAAIGLARYFTRVIGTDASAEQIAHARPHARVQYHVALAEASGLPDESVDLATVAQALHWFDIDAFYREAMRVLAPGGALAVWTYGEPVLDDDTADAILQRFNHGRMGPYWPAARAAVGAGYRDFSFPFHEVPSPSLTLERRWTLGELTGYVRSWSSVARYRGQHGEDPVIAFESEIQ